LYNYSYKPGVVSQPIIPATQKVGTGGLRFEDNLSKISETLPQKHKDWGHGSSGRVFEAPVKSPIPKK
jgi:hypothetical protein